jgi:hypothetical protein
MSAAAKPAPAESTPAVKLTAKERGQLFAEHLILLHLGKSCYKRADFLLDLLVGQSNRHEPIKITRRALRRKAVAAQLREAQKLVVNTIVGKQFAVSDKFAKRNSVPVGQNARRFEVDEVEVA